MGSVLTAGAVGKVRGLVIPEGSRKCSMNHRVDRRRLRRAGRLAG